MNGETRVSWTQTDTLLKTSFRSSHAAARASAASVPTAMTGANLLSMPSRASSSDDRRKVVRRTHSRRKPATAIEAASCQSPALSASDTPAHVCRASASTEWSTPLTWSRRDVNARFTPAANRWPDSVWVTQRYVSDHDRHHGRGGGRDAQHRRAETDDGGACGDNARRHAGDGYDGGPVLLDPVADGREGGLDLPDERPRLLDRRHDGRAELPERLLQVGEDFVPGPGAGHGRLG